MGDALLSKEAHSRYCSFNHSPDAQSRHAAATLWKAAASAFQAGRGRRGRTHGRLCATDKDIGLLMERVWHGGLRPPSPPLDVRPHGGSSPMQPLPQARQGYAAALSPPLPLTTPRTVCSHSSTSGRWAPIPARSCVANSSGDGPCPYLHSSTLLHTTAPLPATQPPPQQPSQQPPSQQLSQLYAACNEVAS